MAADLLQRFVPDIVDRLRKSLAVAMAVEAGPVQTSDDGPLVLLFEEEANLRELIGLLRVLRCASASQMGKASATPTRRRPKGRASFPKHRASKKVR